MVSICRSESLHWGSDPRPELGAKRRLFQELEAIALFCGQPAGADPTVADHQGRLPVDVAHKYGKGAHVSYLKSIGPPIASRRNEDEA